MQIVQQMAFFIDTVNIESIANIPTMQQFTSYIKPCYMIDEFFDSGFQHNIYKRLNNESLSNVLKKISISKYRRYQIFVHKTEEKMCVNRYDGLSKNFQQHNYNTFEYLSFNAQSTMYKHDADLYYGVDSINKRIVKYNIMDFNNVQYLIDNYIAIAYGNWCYFGDGILYAGFHLYEDDKFLIKPNYSQFNIDDPLIRPHAYCNLSVNSKYTFIYNDELLNEFSTVISSGKNTESIITTTLPTKLKCFCKLNF